MTIAVDLGHKATKQTNNVLLCYFPQKLNWQKLFPYKYSANICRLYPNNDILEEFVKLCFLTVCYYG